MTPPGGSWDASDNGTYRIVMRAGQVRDTAGRGIPAGDIGIFRVALPSVSTADTDAPTATLQTVATPQRGAAAHFLDVTFTDATGIDVASLSNGDLLVQGPGGLAITPTFYDVDDYTDGPSRTATYWFIPPGGRWDDLDNGVYTVELAASAVRDTLLQTSSSSQVLGAFTVYVPPPQTRPNSDLAEGNAADWLAWADGATASAGDETSRKVDGQSSLRFETTGGFDTRLAYPAPGVADWDLTTVAELRFSLYAENPNIGFQEGPWVRLNGFDGGYFEYRYYVDDAPAAPINDAVGKWVDFVIPLVASSDGTGWRRTTSGTPTLGHVSSVEFHADTWDSGFVLWLDGVSFQRDSWQNPSQPLDVDGDGIVVPKDVLVIINELNGPRYTGRRASCRRCGPKTPLISMFPATATATPSTS